MERFFSLPATWSGTALDLDQYWTPEFESELTDDAGIHHIVRYEDMIYLSFSVCCLERTMQRTATPFGYGTRLSGHFKPTELLTAIYMSIILDTWTLKMR